jgi:hypothetical protein
VNSTHRIKAAAATLTVGFLLAIAFVGAAQAGNATPKGMTAQQLKAVQARSEAWNRFYHLGAYSKVGSAAEERRAQAMNQYYHLGAFSSAGVAARQAEERRAQALNRYYRLGRYAVVGATSRFDWNDAGIGAGFMLGVIMVAGGLTLVVRRRNVGKASFSSTT